MRLVAGVEFSREKQAGQSKILQNGKVTFSNTVFGLYFLSLECQNKMLKLNQGYNCDSLITNLEVGFFFFFNLFLFLAYGNYFPVHKRRTKAVVEIGNLFQRSCDKEKSARSTFR